MRSYRPKKFNDDGTTVTIDLHGCSIDDGLYIIRRTLQEAHHRGRSRVEVIHGSSTSDLHGYTRTLKNALRQGVDAGDYAEWISGHVESTDGGRTSLWLKLGSSPNSARISESDVVRGNR
jgi:DNA-nicking Smr family endonuclease